MRTNRGNTGVPLCGGCPFHKYEATDGYAFCDITGKGIYVGDQCDIAYETLTNGQAARILHHHQRWRRGAKTSQTPPYLVGAAIDKAINSLRKLLKQKKK